MQPLHEQTARGEIALRIAIELGGEKAGKPVHPGVGGLGDHDVVELAVAREVALRVSKKTLLRGSR